MSALRFLTKASLSAVSTITFDSAPSLHDDIRPDASCLRICLFLASCCRILRAGITQLLTDAVVQKTTTLAIAGECSNAPATAGEVEDASEVVGAERGRDSRHGRERGQIRARSRYKGESRSRCRGTVEDRQVASTGRRRRSNSRGRGRMAEGASVPGARSQTACSRACDTAAMLVNPAQPGDQVRARSDQAMQRASRTRPGKGWRRAADWR